MPVYLPYIDPDYNPDDEEEREQPKKSGVYTGETHTPRKYEDVNVRGDLL